jgi:hypothetical protein
MTDEEALSLPKSHPARFLHSYGSRSRVLATDEDVQQAIDATWSRFVWYTSHPFAADLAACAETNS